MDSSEIEDLETQAVEDSDTEGHNLWIDPGLSADLARSRNKDIEKQARERKRAKEAKKKR